MNALQKHLSDQFHELDELIQKAHIGTIRLKGLVSVKRGNALASLMCTVLGFPKNSDQCPLEVLAEHKAEEMIWQRNFNGRLMVSHFSLVGPYLQESLGMTRMLMKLTVQNGRLVYDLVKTKMLGITLPKFLSPGLTAYEHEDGDKYVFSVEVSLPFIGRLIKYEGRLDLLA